MNDMVGMKPMKPTKPGAKPMKKGTKKGLLTAPKQKPNGRWDGWRAK